MNAFLLLASACLGFSPELVVSPDQPLQYSYLDEPLVIAIASDATLPAQVSAVVRSPRGGETQPLDLGMVDLRSGEESWFSVPELPAGEGFFSVEVTVVAEGETKILKGGFARIRRSTGEHALPVVAYGDDSDPNTLRALRSAPVPAVRIDLLDEQAEAKATALIKQGFKLVPYLDARLSKAPAEVVRKAAESWCDSILRWNVAAGSSVALIEDVAKAVRATSCPAPVVAVVDDIDTFKALIEQGLGNVVRSVNVEVRDNGEWTVSAVQSIAEQAGFEQWDVYATLPAPERGAEEQSYLTKRIFLALAEGFKGVNFHAREIYDNGLTAAFSRLNALSFQLGALDCAGVVPTGSGTQNVLFKRGGDWFLAIWSTGAAKELTLEVGDAGRIKAVDQFNQPVELPEPVKGILPVKVDAAPLYITGRGGSLFDQSARPIAKRLASELSKRSELLAVLGPEVSSAVNSVVLSEGAVTQRTNFFAMLRVLPELERRWHAGELPRHLAVSSISHLARLMRQLCVVEQQRGEAFLEPLQDTLARCEEYQTYYLTSSRGSDDHFERGDWLLGEVRRLMNEANDLAAAGRRIEASAVAALAEWRARGLEFAGGAVQREEEDSVTVALALPEKPVAAPSDAPASAAAVSEGGVHKIAKGDTLGGIATKYKVSLKDLMAWNNLTKKSTLRIGQAIKVVPPGGAPAPEAAEPAAPVAAEAPLKATAPEAQEEAAPEEEPAPEPEPEEEPAPELEEEEAPVQVAPGGTKKIGHTVDRGETTHSIAKKYGVSEADFRKWNGIRAGAQLARGKDYVVYVPQRAAAKAEEKKPEAKAATAGKAPAGQKQITHTVRKGDNPYLIAKKYGVPLDDFMKWNKLTKKSKMQVGEKYIVYVKK